MIFLPFSDKGSFDDVRSGRYKSSVSHCHRF